jgi:hypothetical protein
MDETECGKRELKGRRYLAGEVRFLVGEAHGQLVVVERRSGKSKLSEAKQRKASKAKSGGKSERNGGHASSKSTQAGVDTGRLSWI